MNALYVESAAFSPDGLKIVAVSRDETALHGSKGIVRVWSVTGKCEQTVVVGDRNWRTESVMSVHFSPDGLKIVSASCEDRAVRVWSAATGECEQTLVGHSDRVNSAHFSPDGLKIVSASDDKSGVRLWVLSI